MKSIALHNLGCKVNGYEMDVMQQMLQDCGYQIVPFDQIADIYIVNTCTVTNIADRKSRQMLHRARKRNPKAVVVAVGCYVQTGQEAVLRDAGVDLAIGNNRKGKLVPILEEFLARREKGEPVGEGAKTLDGRTVIDINHTDEYEDMRLKETAGHTRVFIKIQDGCNQFCSYCIIPYARGRVRSRGQEEILEEVRGMAAHGYREIVLTGIHISSYGTDRGGQELPGLIEAIHKIEGVDRIRLGSLEPRIITKEFAARLAGLPKVCPHFHLSLQSGCDSTLKRMNRHYTTGEYYEKVALLRDAFEHPAITTDVIVGFPGETEAEFKQTEAFLEKVKFYEMHVFKYSPRKGTRAAAMEGQVAEEVKAKRSARLLGMVCRDSRQYREYYIGKEAEALFEEEKEIAGEAFQVGHTKEYVKVAKRGEKTLQGSIAHGRILGFLAEDVLWME